ncbi:hypothetical protein HLV37_06865 [Eggerthellaceae bacterium zg-1084]|uniref:hypothetical protein n=1 Tax=Berryella wangjianweii TaxID=2734634 RepID=UPI0015542C0E|nr:hypothetical protein [Berryella wangjianweii]NPD31572.1 hypothetical protein [Berryella wangjianweii]
MVGIGEPILHFLPLMATFLLVYTALRLLHLERKISDPALSIGLSGRHRVILAVAGIVLAFSFAISLLGYVVNLIAIR